MTKAPPRSSQGIVALEEALRQLASGKKWDVRKPLPTTRELGERHGISNASACRLLSRLAKEATLWQRANGRYYLKESRRLFERRKPYACLVRKLQTWSKIYQQLMNGFSHGFGQNQASMLFIHNDTLVRHSDTEHPAMHAGPAEQREILADFFQEHRDQFGGILLDEVWRDEVLEEFAGELTNAVIVCRPTALPGLSSVSVDYDAGALLAVGHLYARGFEEIWLTFPCNHAPADDLQAEAARRAASLLGKAIEAKNILSVATPEDRESFLGRLKKAKKRVGIFCLEDNLSLILRQKLAAEGLKCPEQVGLLSAMGTAIVSPRRISSIKIDYERIGRSAAEILISREKKRVLVPGHLSLGATT